MTEREETLLTIKFLQEEVRFLNGAIKDREAENLDASYLIQRRSLKPNHIESLKGLLKQEEK